MRPLPVGLVCPLFVFMVSTPTEKKTKKKLVRHRRIQAFRHLNQYQDNPLYNEDCRGCHIRLPGAPWGIQSYLMAMVSKGFQNTRMDL
jgi:hypothetical protein